MGEKEEEYPEVQGGGSLILAWQIKDKRVLVVGGGEVRLLLPLYSSTMLLATANTVLRHR